MADHDLWGRVADAYERSLRRRLVGLAAFGSRARGDARPDSDHDLLLVARGLSPDPFERNQEIQAPLDSLDSSDALSVSVLARTPEEFLADITPLHLDLALDAIVLFEQQSFLSHHLGRVRQRIQEAGLERGKDLFWTWKRPPRRDWAISWEGVRV